MLVFYFFKPYDFSLSKIQNSIEQAKITNKELSERNTPELLPPLRMTAKRQDFKTDTMPLPVNPELSCSMNSIHQCFDWSRCPISSGFPVYFYESFSNDEDSWVQDVGKKSGYYTEDPDEACLFVVSGPPEQQRL